MVSFALNFSGRVCASCRFHSAGECTGLIRYYNMEGVILTAPYPVNFESNLPAFYNGPGTALVLNNGIRHPVCRHQNLS